MELIYLYHSGFALLGEGWTVIFDYYEDSAAGNEGVLHRELLERPGCFYVLASHAHADHFNRQVLAWREKRPDIVYLFSTDICVEEMRQEKGIHWLAQGETWQDRLLRVKAFGSTDVGVSFLVEVEGRRIFHAGDLNNWHWMEESDEAEWKGYERHFQHELAILAAEVPCLDVAMFPVDPRLGKEYMRGPRQFVEQIKTTIFVPMHFDEAYQAAAAFRPTAQACGAESLLLEHRGQRVNLFE